MFEVFFPPSLIRVNEQKAERCTRQWVLAALSGRLVQTAQRSGAWMCALAHSACSQLTSLSRIRGRYGLCATPVFSHEKCISPALPHEGGVGLEACSTPSLPPLGSCSQASPLFQCCPSFPPLRPPFSRTPRFSGLSV